MRSMTGVFLTLFLSPLFSLYHSLRCDSKTEYVSPEGKCCSKCKPGERLDKVCTPTSPTKCVPCKGGYYSDRYDEARTCRRCSDCSMIRLEYRINCTTTHNAVCGCERGYQCKSEPCLDCEKITTPDAGKDTTTTKEVSTAPGVKPVKEETKMNCDGSGEQQRGAGLPERQPHRISARRRRGKCLFRKCVKSWKCRNALSLMDRHRRLIAILTLQRTNSNIFWVNNASKCTMTETRNRIGGERKGAKNKRREKDRRKNYTVECIHARIHMHTHKISCIY